MHRRSLALWMSLLFVGCTPKPHYQGDVVLGSFAFTADPPAPVTCTLQAGTLPAPFGFTGVFSYDSKKQVLYLDTDGNTEDDHVGTLTGSHFVLHGSAERDLGCSSKVTIDEVLEGDLFAQGAVVDGGCAAQPADGGATSLPDGGVVGFEPIIACGTLTDTPRPLAGDDGGCPTCSLVYSLSAVRQ